MDRINVTKTFLPPLNEYEAYLERIWGAGFITNQGPLLQEFEDKVSDYLNVKNFHFVANGTLALQVGLRSLELTGCDIITTPFSYVATASSILWEHNNPIFVDIEPDTYCIDVTKIEQSITPNTRAILAVHVFGFPCDVESIQEIADKHELAVLYDGAHAFGVEYKGKSLLSYGDISICSFHATKLFHTIEGGCIVANDKETSDIVELTKRFGHNGDEHKMLGINAKASELQAAMGLANLKYVDEIINDRKQSYFLYDNLISNSAISKPPTSILDTKQNYAYYPIRFKSEKKLLEALAALNEQNIYPRRYFYPSLNKLPYIQNANTCPVSEKVANSILCLPLYKGILEEDIRRIAAIVNKV